MGRSIQNVAVIGAGVSGVLSALHLEDAGFKVTVYERSSSAGGIWMYDSRRPPEPDYPSVRPSVADFNAEKDTENEDLTPQDVELDGDQDRLAEVELLHAPPGPCYEGLVTNVPTAMSEFKNQAWEPGTPNFVSHRLVKDYIQAAARRSGPQTSYLFSTRVERIWKRESKWQIQSTALTRAANGNMKKSRRFREFDAVVVASGHYHACRVPDIVGLKAWRTTWPNRVYHSKSYRNPNEYKNQNVLLIGAGVSSTDIARELSPIARQIYQSCRGGDFDLPTSFLPQNARRVAEVSSFNLSDQHDKELPTSAQEHAIPTTITLKDGTVLRDIHQVLLCTGYHHSYPFLRQLHRDTMAVQDADQDVLVTDGTQMHNLHQDIFYIPDPTLSFMGVPYYSATLSLFEFQAIAVAAVYAGRANLPSRGAMREAYRERLKRKGHGRRLHSMLGEEVSYVQDLVGWINKDGAAQGAKPVEGHTQSWHAANANRSQSLRKDAGVKGNQLAEAIRFKGLENATGWV